MSSEEEPKAFMTNLELRESNPDGTEGEGLSHKSMAGLFLLHTLEVAASGEPWGGLCWVHGQGDHGGRYRKLADVLARSGLAVALADYRGHGQSEGERGHSWGVPERMRDITSVTDHLSYMMQPDDPRMIGGQGLGAFYALCYAIERPDACSALVLSSPVLEPHFDVPQKVGGLKGLFKKVGPTSAGTVGYRPDQLTSLGDEQAAWTSDPLVHDAITVRAAESIAEGLAKYRPRFGEIACPVLLLQGADDSIGSVAAAKSLEREGVEVRIEEGARHDLFHDVGAEARMEAVRDWLASTLRK